MLLKEVVSQVNFDFQNLQQEAREAKYCFSIGLLVNLTPNMVADCWSRRASAWAARAMYFGCHSVCLSVIMGIHFQAFKIKHLVLYSH